MKLLNSGQTCIAPDYVLAERSIADELVDKIVANMREFRSGESDPSMRIVNQRQFDRLVSLISATDGKVVTGGGFDSARAADRAHRDRRPVADRRGDGR